MSKIYLEILDKDRLEVEIGSLPLATIKDIAADKAHTLGRRAVWRDYADFFFLLRDQWITLEEVSSLAEKKFGGEFNKALFLQQLCYFKDVSETEVEFIGEPFSTNEIKRFLERKVMQYVKETVKR